MKFNLSVEVDDQLLRDLRQHFDIGDEIVRQDLQAALERTVETYERDLERKKPAPRTSCGTQEVRMKQAITIPCTLREAKELESVLTEFLQDCDFFLGEGLDIEEAACLRWQRQRATHWSSKLPVAQARARKPRLERRKSHA
jgi:hypothetical protein